MPDDSPGPSEREQVLAGLFSELEALRGAGPDVEAVIRRHPDLEGEIRELLALRVVLDGSPPHHELPLPARLGEFRIVRRLETGGMGDVYEAWQESLHRRVAVKVLRHGRRSPLAGDRFMREQRVLARLHQTNIVPIHAAGREGEFEYFAMPFIDGAALRYVVETADRFRSAQPATETPDIAELVGHARAGRRERAGTRAAPAALATGAEPAAGPEPPPFRPSPRYLRSVARVIADAARAVQHAHEQGILHRDIKPSNIMVEAHAQADGRRTDVCWVIDFGLSSYRDGSMQEEGASPGAPDAHGHGAETSPATSGVMGTPAYMAPEQFERRADERTDVWGLGVTLYELLTLRRAFREPATGSAAERLQAVRESILRHDPPRPRDGIPRDLQAICFKALRKDPSERYASARALADDLARWLDGEVVLARCEEAPLLATPLRCARWARRNRGWTAAIGTAFAASVIVVAMLFIATDERRLTEERQRMVQAIELNAAPPRTAGWSDRARSLALRLSAGSTDDRLWDAFSLCLSGMDAQSVGLHEGRASSLAFDEARGEWLLGGAPAESGYPKMPGKSWKPGVGDTVMFLRATGPVACRPDGSRVQLVHAGALSYELREMLSGAALASFVLPVDDPAITVPVTTEVHQPVMVMTADSAVAAAAVTVPSTKYGDGDAGAVVAWEVTTGGVLLEQPVRATALALSASGRLLAVGDREGRVDVWSLPDRRRVSELRGERDEVQALAFGPDPLAVDASAADGNGLRLAVGCVGGRITVWDVARQHARSPCRGMEHRVLALAFSPDGRLLAGAGADVMLWDGETGERLLDFRLGFANTVAFSADGRSLAIGRHERFMSPGDVSIWNLQPGRGIRTLRGLDSSIHIVAFSPDGRLVAGFSNDWQIAIWDCATCALRRVLQAPRGFSCDNAGLAFSTDATRIACVSGTEARLWDVATGALVQRWLLPAGLIDGLAFDDRGDLIVARCEPGKFAGLPPERTHGVCRVRNLSPGGGLRTLLQVPDFDVKVVSLVLDPRGRWVAIEGDTSTAGAPRRSIRAFDLATGRDLWPLVPCTKARDNSNLRVDPTGEFLSLQDSDAGPRTLVAMPSGETVDCTMVACGLGPGADIYLTDEDSGGGINVLNLIERGSTHPFLRLRQGNATRAIFDRSAKRLAWGNPDGTVMLGDLTEIRHSRAELDRER